MRRAWVMLALFHAPGIVAGTTANEELFHAGRQAVIGTLFSIVSIVPTKADASESIYRFAKIGRFAPLTRGSGYGMLKKLYKWC